MIVYFFIENHCKADYCYTFCKVNFCKDDLHVMYKCIKWMYCIKIFFKKKEYPNFFALWNNYIVQRHNNKENITF